MKIGAKNFKESLIKILKKFWQNLFFAFLFLLILDLILGGIFFWNYYFKEKELKNPAPLKINQALLKKFSSTWQEKEELLKSIEQKKYPDLFQGWTSQ